ncbi:FAD-dependent monooxygenase [Streptomyces sp. NPDC051130]|uniref:FAD-dependent monooxygenase n=1 Tax=Streptomyces sp. NPDC051130 TaxID=3157223 RepID=UPI003440828A
MTEQPRRRLQVVGASAAGLTVAHELARRGLPVRVVEAAAGPATTGRVVTLHPRTLEVLDQMDVIDGFLHHGHKSDLAADHPTLPTLHPYTLVIDRARAAALLREAVADLGVSVEWGVRPRHPTAPARLITCDGSAQRSDPAGGRLTVVADHDPDTGIRQAYNLAWKLAMVEQGLVGPRLLDTYDEEHPAEPRPRRGIRALLHRVPALRRTDPSHLSGLRLTYRNSSLTTWNTLDFLSGYHVGAVGAEPTPVPAPGSRVTEAGPACGLLRAELRDPRWSLLLATGSARRPQGSPESVAATAAAQYSAYVSVRIMGAASCLPDPAHRLRAALGTPPGGWLLIRPDGYVAARGSLLTTRALDRALSPLSVAPLRIGAHPCG